MLKNVSVIVFFLFTALACGQDKPKPDPFPPDFYSKKVSKLKEQVNHLTDNNFYEKLEFKNKKTGEVKKLKDFDEFEQQTFFIIVAEKLTQNLADKATAFEEVMNNVDDEDLKDDLETAIIKLKSLRHALAKRWENLVEATFKKYKEKFTAEEMEQYRKKMHETNDKDKLIERK